MGLSPESRDTSSTETTSKRGDGLTNRFLFKDRCAAPDQISFVLTFPWSRLVLAVRDLHRSDKDEIAIFVFRIAAKYLCHEMPP